MNLVRLSNGKEYGLNPLVFRYKLLPGVDKETDKLPGENSLQQRNRCFKEGKAVQVFKEPNTLNFNSSGKTINYWLAHRDGIEITCGLDSLITPNDDKSKECVEVRRLGPRLLGIRHKGGAQDSGNLELMATKDGKPIIVEIPYRLPSVI